MTGDGTGGRGITPETMKEAIAMCFADESDFRITGIRRNDADTATEAELEIASDRFCLCVYDEAVEDAGTAADMAARLSAFSMSDVVKSIPGHLVSVTRSGCIFGPV